MCGTVGVLSSNKNVAAEIYDSLVMIQHRGQDAAGIMTVDNRKVFMRKANGLVNTAIKPHHLLNLKGNMGLGHVRYPTAGTHSPAEAQPFYVNSPYGICMVHNGNLINTDALSADLFASDLRHLNTDSDSEVLLNVFAHELHLLCKEKQDFSPQNLFKAVSALHKRCSGAYAVIIMIVGHGLLAFRDPYGIRPLVWGAKNKVDNSFEYMVASESVALSALNYQLEGDIAPGEAIFIGLDGQVLRSQCADSHILKPCIFEYVYLSRPDSIIDGILVYDARLNMGKKLARKILREFPALDIDVVIPIPETSRLSALYLAQELGLPYVEGFIKNPYIGRTFIMPQQYQRERSVKQKLNVISKNFMNKKVLLVDDSIVRGTTSREVVSMARQAGAKEVYLASLSPEIRYPNVYGIDMPVVNDLVAANRSLQEIADYIGAEKVFFQDLTDLKQCLHECNPNISDFEDSVFSGNYITGSLSSNYFSDLAIKRSKNNDNENLSIVDIYNQA